MHAMRWRSRPVALVLGGLLSLCGVVGCGAKGPVFRPKDGGSDARSRRDGGADRMPIDTGPPLQDATADDAALDDGATDAGTNDADGGDVPACDMLEQTSWSGPTPFGEEGVTVHVDQFSNRDCVDFSAAIAILRNDAGDALSIRFSYPVSLTEDDSRYVEGTFEREAEIDWNPATGTPMRTVGTIRVEVTRWVEHPPESEGHEIEARIWFEEAGFGSDPVVLRGRYCVWRSLLC